MTEIRIDGTFEDWREEARDAVLAELAPDRVRWIADTAEQPSLFGETLHAKPRRGTNRNLDVPAGFVVLARAVSCHCDSTKWDLLYRLLWRLAHGERNLLKVETDDTVLRLLRMRQQVSREVHKMHAFVRFRKVTDEHGDTYVAWYEPRHDVLRAAAPFFVERFSTMRWSILTPSLCAHWDRAKLTFSNGVPRSDAPTEDALEEFWKSYYGAIYNPARTNLQLMRAEMPTHFWKELPELANLPQMLSEAPGRIREMIRRQQQAPSAKPFVPETRELRVLSEAARACVGCQLGSCATQTVFGEGPEDARMVLVGEQPGNDEDLSGRPFVGPAGEVLDRAMQAAGLDRRELYLTNAVKHFGFVERGQARIHRTPRLIEIVACRPWLQAEVEALRPQVLVCLGATAAKSAFGQQFRLTEQRGAVLASSFADQTIATFHPSAVLRAQDVSVRETLFRDLVEDLTLARRTLAESPKALPRVAG